MKTNDRVLIVGLLLLNLLLMHTVGLAFITGGGLQTSGTIYFGSGTVFDFNAGDVTLTHSADALTLAGGQLLYPDGTAALPSVARSAATGTGMRFQGNAITFGIAGTEYFAVGAPATTDVTLRSTAALNWSSGSPYSGTADLIFGREAAAVLKMGIDAAVPVAQIFKGPDARAGTDTNTVGGVIAFAGGRPTGTGIPGLVGFQGSLLSTTTGTVASALVDRFIANAAKVLTNNSAIAVVNATIANGSTVGGLLTYTIEVTNGTDYQVETGQAVYSSQNKAGTVAGTITKINAQQNLSVGTLATTWAISNANPAVLSINANSSLVPSTGYPRITFSVQNLGQQAIAIQ